MPTLREVLNAAFVQEVPDSFRQAGLGEMLGFLIQSAAFTETAAAVTSNAKALANAASAIFDVVATAGTVTGRKALKIAPASYTPVTGEVVWAGPGTTGLRFAAADAVTAVSVKYARTDGVNVLTSELERQLGQRDG